jgi:hypothetical protein
MSNWVSKIKESYRTHKTMVLLGIIIFLTSCVSFQFGYYARQQTTYAPIIIEKCSQK